MSQRLSRLLQAKSIAVIGGGAWCSQVILQARKMGFDGEIWPVHPTKAEVSGTPAFPSVEDLPEAPDSAFIGVNRRATVEVVAALSALGCGGAVCFASGFSEAQAEDDTASNLQDALIAAAGDMPILGPNCYGFINALDNTLLWPDQHGCNTVESGVAILTQSSNISINLTMQTRQLPIAYMITCGNMAQTSQAEIAMALLNDPRVTAIGLHIEGFGTIPEWEELAAAAHEKGIPIVAIKVGKSEQARAATVSHTASLAGSDAGATALLDRLGIARLSTLPTFLETLKLLHCHGPLANGNIASISCSGGEASLVADMADNLDLRFPDLKDQQLNTLREALGPMVALSNPLDYHTYIWRDRAAMTKAWSGMTGGDIAMTLSVVDYPRTDPADWIHATKAAIAVRKQTGQGFAVVATLPELMPEDTAHQLMDAGVVPFMGLQEALEAVEVASKIKPPLTDALLPVGPEHEVKLVPEFDAKQALSAVGISVPKGHVTSASTPDLCELTAPLAVKGVGLAHKSEHSAVRLSVQPSDIEEAAREIGTPDVLIEEMVQGTLAELIIGVVRDPAHGFVLTIGAGSVLTEILKDTVSFLIPTPRDQIDAGLSTLAIAPILNGYRGKPAINRTALLDAIMAVQSYVEQNADCVSEVEINPLMCTADSAIAADALIRRS
ncbi:acetate--CoA ligase family protein [Cognatiyoonia sp.]|uniref:acetate--CoA ligase family protein n=1 Tax=Cognatiyoonia sp. TaxID=2211652 RepID=UPI003F699D37